MKNGKHKHLFACGTALALMIGATGGVLYFSNQAPLHAKAFELSAGDSLFGKINGTIPVIKASNNDTSSTAFQNTVDSITRGISSQPRYLVQDIQWSANTRLANASSGTIQPLRNWVDSKGYTIFSDVKGNPKSLYVDGFNGNDLGVQLPIDGTGAVRIVNVGTVKDLESDKTINVDLQVTIGGVNLVSPASNAGVIFSAKNQGSTLSLGVTPIQSGGTSAGGSSEGGSSSGDGSTVVGANLGWMDKVQYFVTLRNHDTGETLPADQTIMAMKVSDIDGYQLANVGKEGLLGVIVSNDTSLSINGEGLSFNGAGTTVADGKNLNKGSYIAIKQWNNIGVNFADQAGLGDPNEGTHYDIVANLFGKLNFQLNLKGSHKIVKTQTKQHENQGSGAIAGTTFDETVFKSDGKTVATDFNGSFPILDANGKDTGNKAVFKNGVAKNLTTGKDGTIYIKDYVPIGFIVKDVETSVPEPYTLGHTNAEGKLVNDPISSTIVGGSTGIATANFTDNKQVGGVKIAKTGLWSDVDMLNSLYTLKGNVFTISDKDGNVLQTITTDEKGIASSTDDPTASPLVIGQTYTVKEITSSDGFANTFEDKTVEFTYQGADQTIDWGNVSGTNTEVTGDFELQKNDQDTKTTETQGNATLSGSDWSIYYAKDVTNAKGEVIHHKDDIVLLSDGFEKNPIEVLKGTVVTNKLATEKDALTLRVDDKRQIQVKNLPEGDYYRKETQAPYGYTLDTTQYPFTVMKTDDETKVIDVNHETDDNVLRFSFRFLKALGHDGSLTKENGAKFELKPTDDGTKAINTEYDNANDTTVTGSTLDADGYTSDGQGSFSNVAIGNYTMHQTVVPEGTEAVDDILIEQTKVTEDGAPDKYIITFRWKDSGQLISSHEIDASKLVDGNVSMIKLNLGTFTDNETPTEPKKPSIDIEKANDSIPNAGNGNNTDKDNNIGVNDHDTEETAFDVKAGEATPIFFRVTNNGSEELTKIKVVDKTTDGKVDVKDITWTFGKTTLKVNSEGQFTLENGTLLTLKQGESITAKGTLGAIDSLHSDDATVTGIGVTSKTEVKDHDKWYGTTPKPSIDVEKTNDEFGSVGNGNNTDKDNNAGKNDHDTQATAYSVASGKSTAIKFLITNNGSEALTKVAPVDKTTDGKVDVKDITWTYKDKAITLNKDGQFIDADGKLIVLQPKESIKGTGTLGALPTDSLHSDEITVTGIGVTSGKKVGDKDKWFGKVPTLLESVLPKTGENNTGLYAIYGAILIGLSGLFYAFLNKDKVMMAYRKWHRKLKK